MTKKPKRSPILLRWSDHVPASDVQDPLGLGLRGSTRIASRLLFCITSITPRARYFSFIPWCIRNWQKHEKGQGFALGLRDAIALRERALTLGCVAHHEGKPCVGGALVGSDNVAKWFAKGAQDIDLRKLPFAKNPALGAYFNSLVNLGCFVTEDDRPAPDETEEDAALTFDDIELSELGRQLAESYGSRVDRLDSVRKLSSAARRVTVRSLRELGKRGGLCELMETTSLDRQPLQDVFFARTGLTGDSHFFRNRSLCLLLELCRQLSADNWILNEAAFASATYYGEVVSDDGERIDITWPNSLSDIATRWRMFYFHHYMSVALEGLFAWLVTQASDKGIAGVSVKDLSDVLDLKTVSKGLSELLAVPVPARFGAWTPSQLFQSIVSSFVDLDNQTSRMLDRELRATDLLSEERLENSIRSRTILRSPLGLAVPMVLLALTLARHAQWDGTRYGNWLASASSDPYLDIVPPALAAGLQRRFGRWWECNWNELAGFVLGRYVVQQHQSMSYEKTAKGDRCLLFVDEGKITTGPNESFEKIGMGNPRFRSAVRILTDLGLLAEAEGIATVTSEGVRLLTEELTRERGE